MNQAEYSDKATDSSLEELSVKEYDIVVAESTVTISLPQMYKLYSVPEASMILAYI